MITFGSVCSGIEAASVAWGPLGWRAEWFSEIEPFPSAVLAHHYPEVPNLGDMTTIARRVLTGEVEAPDLLCGGTPCQAFSVAGLRNSLDDERGNLTLKFVELADAIDHVRGLRGKPPAIVFWENVPGVLSTKDNAFGCFLAGLAGEDEPLLPPGQDPEKPIRWSVAGCVLGPQRAIAWRTLDAQYFGVAQRRRRVFVVASARNGFDPAQVLFEWDGLRRDSAPSREAGKGVAHDTAPCLTSSGRGVERTGDTRGQDPVIAVAFGGNNKSGPIDVATARNACASASGRMDFETETFLVHATHTMREVPPTLTSNYGKQPDSSDTSAGPMLVASWAVRTANTSANGHGISPECAHTLDQAQGQCVAFDTTQITSAANYSNPKPGDPCHPLAAVAHAPAIAFPANLSGTQCASTEELAPSMGAKNPTAVAFAIQAGALRTNPLSGPDGVGVQADHAYTLEARAEVQAVAVALRGREGGATAELGDEVQNCLRASSGGGDKPHVLAAMQVRRLTPVECERLQGFPDNYTRIPSWNGWRKLDADETPEALMAEGMKVKQNTKTGLWRVNDVDGPRYKALGNSWAVPVVRWIGQRIHSRLKLTQAKEPA